MRSNVEIKARVGDLDVIRGRLAGICRGTPRVLEQEDTFFRVSRGRLKLRITGSGPAELIWYDRSNDPGPKRSQYTVHPTDDPASLRVALAEALGIIGVVRKRREIYLAGRTRIHLDRVEGLGAFVELEVVLEPGEPPEEGRLEAERLMDRLAICRGDLVSGAYVDLLAARARGAETRR